MPRGDGTGPFGQGPMTGRGMGFCASYPYLGYAGSRWGYFGAGRGSRPRGGGRGRVWGGGRGRGWWHGYPGWAAMPYPAYDQGIYEWAPRNIEEEKKFVNDEIRELEIEIEERKKYLAELEKEQKK